MLEIWRYITYSRAHETNLSAEEAKARQGARFPFTNDDHGGPQSPEPPPCKRTQAPLRFRVTMPKKNRLTGAEIRSVRSPRRLHGGFFSVSISASRTGNAQFACVVSKKVAMKAVTRNLIRRRCRAVLEKSARSTPPGVYMFLAKKDAAKATYSELAHDIETLLRNIRGAH